MADKDAKFFNCSEEHELNYVSGKYKDREKVREFIKEKCKDKTIHYWTQEKLAEFLAQNGFELKSSKTQAELLNDIAAKLGSRSQAQTALNAVISSLADVLKSGDSIALKGFGTFKVVERSARKGRNPRTGMEMEIAASKSVKFTPSSSLRTALNEA